MRRSSVSAKRKSVSAMLLYGRLCTSESAELPLCLLRRQKVQWWTALMGESLWGTTD